MIPSNPPPAGGSMPHRQPRRGWLLALAGVGLFLAGGVVGAVLILSLRLYQAPVPAPATSVAAAATVAPPSPHVSPSATPIPTPAPSPTPSPIPVGPAVGQQAPPFILLDLEGGEHTLESYRGQVVVLNFWASWCPPCRLEWPELIAFAQERADQDEVVILAVNVEEAAEVVREYVEEAPPPFAVLRDPDSRVSDLYRVTALPTTFLLDREGIVRQVVPGNLTAADLAGMLDSLPTNP